MSQTRERAISRWHIVVVSLAAICFIAEASTGVSKKSRSLVDCLISRKMPSKFADRAILAAADTHTVFKKMGIEYRGTRDQNLHLVADLCPERNSSYGYGRGRRSRESFALQKSPEITWDQYHEIRQAIRDTARANGVDEEQALQLIGCESIGFNPKATNVSYITVKGVRIRTVDRGIGQINDYFHPEVTEAQAYNWRYNIGWTIRTAKVEFVPKKGKYKGELYSQAAWWICRSSDKYLNYGIASIRAQPKSSQFASNSD